MPEPTKIPRPFADSGDKNAIPDSSGSIGFASWQEGFPAITSEPFASGGVAPKRADFNGIFNALSLATVWQQQGGFYAYDATTDYEVGNVVEYGNDLYKCITANGPSSAVKDPTDATVWSKVMTAADAAAAFLPLSGGTLTGNIQFNKNIPTITGLPNDSYIRILNENYEGGASLYLSGKNRSSATGQFALYAFDGTNRKVLIGSPTGELTWGTDDVFTSAGGTITGEIISGATYSLRKSDNTKQLTLIAGANGQAASGAKLVLNGADYTNSGWFTLQAGNSGGYKQFLGKPDGTLTWSGKDVAIVEIGTWTPTLRGASTAGSFTYDTNTEGYYVRLGKLVYIFCRIATTDYSTHPTGRVKIGGLPYTSVNYSTSYAMVNATGYAGGVNSSVMKICGGFVPYNGSSIDLLAQSSDTPWQKAYAQFSSSSSTGYNIQFNSSNKTANLYATGCYECA